MITAEQASRLPGALRGLRVLGRRTVHFDSLPSTQDELVRCADRVPDGTVLTARTQTDGRGRAGRRWASPPGTLAFSVVMHPALPAESAGTMMLAASVSLHDALRRYAPEARIKWPNDILLDGRKVAGTLLDVSVEDGVRWVVVGVGVNVSSDPDAIAGQLDGDGRFAGAASLSGSNPDASGFGVLVSFLTKMDARYADINRGLHHRIPRAYEARCSTIGRTVRAGGVEGTAVGVDSGGALRVRTAAGPRRVTCDVTGPCTAS